MTANFGRWSVFDDPEPGHGHGHGHGCRLRLLGKQKRLWLALSRSRSHGHGIFIVSQDHMLSLLSVCRSVWVYVCVCADKCAFVLFASGFSASSCSDDTRSSVLLLCSHRACLLHVVRMIYAPMHAQSVRHRHSTIVKDGKARK
jgi:hypothetical protein